MISIPRRPIPKATQVQVFHRDEWLCRWCKRPVIFPGAMKFLARFVSRVNKRPLAYYNPNWRRDLAPLLDELGASVDHVEAHSGGGSDDISNLATICGKCNVRKNNRPAADHLKRYPLKKVKDKYGEPAHWDGLSSVFLVLVDGDPTASMSDRQWAKALKTENRHE